MQKLSPTPLLLLIIALLPLLAAPQSGVTVNTPDAQPGYTLIAPMTSTTTFLVNNSGDVLHTWESNHAPGMSVYLLDDGSILRPAVIGPRANPVFRAGGASGRVERFDWEGNLIWEFEYASDRFYLHHDVAPLPNGNILMIAWELKSEAEALAAGRNPDLLPDRALWPDHIIEVQPTSSSGGRIVWEWHAWDHLIQNHDPAKPNFGDPAEHPERIDLNHTRRRPNADWNHINAIDYNAERDEILLSVLGFDEFWVIDHSTTTEEAAGSTGGRSGKGGDLLYRWGNPQTYGLGTTADQQLFALHDAEWIDPPLPGARNILVFVNGGNRPEGAWSSVLEITPPLSVSSRYLRSPDEPFGPPAPTWSYQAPVYEEFFSRNISGAQRLPNGNTLITSGASGHVFEVTPAGETVWSYYIPLSASGRSLVFRADRYPPDHPAFAGRNLAGDSAAIVNAASYWLGSAAPGSIASAFGAELTTETASTDALPLPTELEGVEVELTGEDSVPRLAPLFFVSPGQINFLIPQDLSPGNVTWQIRSDGETTATGALKLNPIAPALFTANANGAGPGMIAALSIDSEGNRTTLPVFEYSDSEQLFVPVPIPLDTDVYLVLYGTGFRGLLDLDHYEATIDGEPVPVIAAAAQSEFAGLDQINIGPLPKSLAGRGQVTLELKLESVRANPVTLAF